MVSAKCKDDKDCFDGLACEQSTGSCYDPCSPEKTICSPGQICTYNKMSDPSKSFVSCKCPETSPMNDGEPGSKEVTCQKGEIEFLPGNHDEHIDSSRHFRVGKEVLRE